MMVRRIVLVMLLVVTAVATPNIARADELYSESDQCYTIVDQDGNELFTIGGKVFEDDEYISEDNKRYRVTSVDHAAATGVATFVEDVLFDEEDAAVDAAADNNNQQKTVALYCTHTDESYTPTDGSDSKVKGGGILDVATGLADSLKSLGINAVLSKNNHVPHDSGAYRRSRRTALSLIKDDKPDMIVDVHRDATPAKEYERTIDGVDASRVRIVIGRSNTNRSENEAFAKKIKNDADQKYPGLVKDIFIGKGNYNQDLMAQSILLEFGTDTIKKDLALESTKMMANVIADNLGVSTSNQSGVQSNAQQQQANQNTTYQIDQQKDKGNWKIILWVFLGLLVIGGVVLFLASSHGSVGQNVKQFSKEVTGIGHKERGSDDRNHS